MNRKESSSEEIADGFELSVDVSVVFGDWCHVRRGFNLFFPCYE